MKKLNQKSARILAQKYFKKIKGKEDQDFSRIHTEAVVEISTILAKKFKANLPAVVIASWVHDIGYVTERTNHARHSLEILEKEGFLIDSTVNDCVLNHGTGCNPQTKEGKILQASDKLSILSIPVLKLLLKQKNILPDDIEFLKKMTDGAVSHMGRLKF